MYRSLTPSTGVNLYAINRLDLSDPNSTPVTVASFSATSSPEPGQISANGKYLAYVVGNGTGGNAVLMLVNMDNLSLSPITVSSATLTVGNYFNPTVSDDGRFVAYMAYTSNGGVQIQVQDLSQMSAPARIVVSNPAYTKGGLSLVRNPRLSFDGHFLAFEAPGPSPNTTTPSHPLQVWALDLSSSTSSPVLVSAASPTDSEFGSSPRFSLDHQSLDFFSFATNLSGASSSPGLSFRKALNNLTGAARVLALPGVSYMGSLGSSNPTISGNGNLVAFSTTSNNLLSGHFSGQQILVKDLAHPENPPVLASSLDADPRNCGTLASSNPLLSFDGKSVIFYSQSPELAPGTSLPTGSWAKLKKDLTNLSAPPTVLGVVSTLPDPTTNLLSPDQSFNAMVVSLTSPLNADAQGLLSLWANALQILLRHN